MGDASVKVNLKLKIPMEAILASVLWVAGLVGRQASMTNGTSSVYAIR